jgi:hypothetical protein
MPQALESELLVTLGSDQRFEYVATLGRTTFGIGYEIEERGVE